MKMRIDKLSVNAQQIISNALVVAADAKAAQLSTTHLFYAMLEDENGNLKAILERVGCDVAQIKYQVKRVIDTDVKVEGTDPNNPSISSEFEKTIDYSVKIADKMGDSYVTNEHLLIVVSRAPAAIPSA